MLQFTKSLYIVNPLWTYYIYKVTKKRTAFILHHAIEDGPLLYYNY